jgi:hypothetical protein
LFERGRERKGRNPTGSCDEGTKEERRGRLSNLEGRGEGGERKRETSMERKEREGGRGFQHTGICHEFQTRHY